jgi:hypothetical protein
MYFDIEMVVSTCFTIPACGLVFFATRRLNMFVFLYPSQYFGGRENVLELFWESVSFLSKDGIVYKVNQRIIVCCLNCM